MQYSCWHLRCRGSSTDYLQQRKYTSHPTFIFLVLLAPALFSLKIALDIPLYFSGNPNWNNYWEHVLYWPLLAFITSAILFILWKILDKDQPFYGVKTSGMSWKPYWMMLADHVSVDCGGFYTTGFFSSLS